MNERTSPAGAGSDFYGLGIAPNILDILDKLGFKTPTPIQEKSIPSAIEGKDLMGLAQTGTGKTLAFGVPMIQAALAGKQGLVILPTRELALQVEDTFKKIGGPLGLRTALIIGGEAMGRQLTALKRGPDIVIGTPGRLVDHLQQKTISLGKVSILVLDEADRMLDMGFAPQLRRILEHVPPTTAGRQTMLFSATMPEAIVKLANSYMKLPLRIEIASPGTTTTKITQELFFIDRNDKSRLLERLLGEYRGSVLVFTRTKFGAKKIASSIRALGHTGAEIHSNRSLSQRREALDGFRNGRYRVLVATDIAARGIDVKGIELVVNFDLPMNAEDYVHRIGRTGRAGATGHAISFATPDQRRDVRDIERLMRIALPPQTVPELPPHRGSPSIPIDARPFSPRPYRPASHSSRGPVGSRPFRPRSPRNDSGSGWSSSGSSSPRPSGPRPAGGPRRASGSGGGPTSRPGFRSRFSRPA